MKPFVSRFEAGRLLAQKLDSYRNHSEALVLALPRGGVPVAYEIAKDLNLFMDVFLVRKLGAPGNRELAMGAIASGGLRILNEGVVQTLGISKATIESVTLREQTELQRRERLYRGDRSPLNLLHRTIILVDDGLATGATMLAAVLALRQRRPARIVVAVPVAAAETCDKFKSEVDEIVCEVMAESFYAVGVWYEEFAQLSDEEVAELLDRASLIKESTEKL
jgi:putative phosphoribosyl transferase